MATIPDTSVKPTVVVTPDSRFATTFLSTKYRDRAVNGEALMDKSTGELFIKRINDGKIVSFYQNKKMIDDLVLEFRFMITNNTSFSYPRDTETSYYVSTNYDLVAINNESLYNLMTDNISIAGAPNDINKLIFKVSGKSNGFFCRNSTRDIDKPIVEFLTNQYNTIFKNYDGSNTTYLAEKAKFNNAKWEDSNAILTYDLLVNKAGTDYNYNNNIAYIRMNEDSCVLLPEKIYTELGSFDYATVTIKSISYDKIHFMINHKDEFGLIFTESYNKLINYDNRIEVCDFNIVHFINDANDIELRGNESIIAFVDIPHLVKYMHAMDRMQGASSLVISNTKPSFACTWFKPYDLQPPTIEIRNNILTITSTDERIDAFDIYANENLEATIDARTGDVTLW